MTSPTQNSGPLLKKLPLMGPVVWLYSQVATHRHFFVSDLEWLLMPPILLDQCKLFMKQDAPVAFASWAWLDEAAETRILQGHPKLSPTEWNRGEKAVLMDFLAPFGGGEDLLIALKNEHFPHQPLYRLQAKPGASGFELVEVSTPARH